MRCVSVREGSQAMSSNVQGVSLRIGCAGRAVVADVGGIVRRVVVDVDAAGAESVIGCVVDDAVASIPDVALPLLSSSTFFFPLPLFHPPFAFIPAFATFTATPAIACPRTPAPLFPSSSSLPCS